MIGMPNKKACNVKPMRQKLLDWATKVILPGGELFVRAARFILPGGELFVRAAKVILPGSELFVRAA